MPFQITALAKEDFADLFLRSDSELRDIGAERQVVQANPGAPCRVSMVDAEVGETVILLNYQHQAANTAFRSSHAIFVREQADQSVIPPNRIPAVIASRIVSLRFFDRAHMMIHADIASGAADTAKLIEAAFAQPDIAYGHIHYAKPGCFAASVQRAG